MLETGNRITDSRLAIARAACAEAGLARTIPDPLPPHRRTYLFAVPDAESCHSCDRLVDALEDRPHLVDWEPDSPFRGVRYMDRAMSLSRDLERFTAPEAVEEWRAWRREESEERRMIAAAARLEARRTRSRDIKDRGIER